MTSEGREQPRQRDFHGLEWREFHQELTAVGIVRALGIGRGSMDSRTENHHGSREGEQRGIFSVKEERT